MMRRILIFLALALMSGVGFAATGDDWGFYYQAQILDAGGNVISNKNGQIIRKHSVELNLYAGALPTDSSGSVSLWTGTFTVFCDDSGLFNVFIADSTSKSKPATTLESVFMKYATKPLYIGLSVKTEGVSYTGEILPRQRLGAVPYAAYANVASVLAGDPATIPGNLNVPGALICYGDLNTESVTVAGALNVVGEISVNDNVIEGVPVYGILLWERDTPPSGTWDNNGTSSDGRWQKCNGENGSPNLQGRFPIGVSGSYSLNVIGGETNVTLTVANIPSHFHRHITDHAYGQVLETIAKRNSRYTIYGDPKEVKPVTDDSNRYKLWSVSTRGGTPDDWTADNTMEDKEYLGVAHTGGAGGKEEKYGSETEPHENMPPYYALYYIMRKK